MTIERNHSERKCSRCGITKPLEQFDYYHGYLASNRKHRPYCLDCQALGDGRVMPCKCLACGRRYPQDHFQVIEKTGKRDRYCPACRESHPYRDDFERDGRRSVAPLPERGYHVAYDPSDPLGFATWGHDIALSARRGEYSPLETPGFEFGRGAILRHPEGWELVRRSGGWGVNGRPSGAPATDWG